jgi:hypothetical protein
MNCFLPLSVGRVQAPELVERYQALRVLFRQLDHFVQQLHQVTAPLRKQLGANLVKLLNDRIPPQAWVFFPPCPPRWRTARVFLLHLQPLDEGACAEIAPG